MKYPYIVKFNGKLYKAGEDVPNDISEVKVEKEEVKKVVVEESATPSLSLKEESAPKKKYTANAIRKMSKDELIELATSLGFNGADELTTVELKRNLMRYLQIS